MRRSTLIVKKKIQNLSHLGVPSKLTLHIFLLLTLLLITSMSQKKNTRANAAVLNLSQTDTGGAHGAARDDIVQDLLDDLESKKSKTEHEKTALAVAKLLTPILSAVVTRIMEPVNNGTQKMQAAIRKNSYDLDKLQQYGRRENLRISGLPEEEGENLKDKIVKVGQVMGVEILNRDINVAHRSGPKGVKPRQIICRFVSRDTKIELLRNKKKLKESEEYKNVYMHEDLTPLRAKATESR